MGELAIPRKQNTSDQNMDRGRNIYNSSKSLFFSISKFKMDDAV